MECIARAPEGLYRPIRLVQPSTFPKRPVFGNVVEPSSRKTTAGRLPPDTGQASFSGKSFRDSLFSGLQSWWGARTEWPKPLNVRCVKNFEV